MELWYLLESTDDYNRAMQRYEMVKRAVKGSDENREKILLVALIEQYEKAHSDLPDLDPIELIKIRMEDFGFQPPSIAS